MDGMSRVSLLAAAEVLCLHPPVTAAGHSVSVRLAIGASKFCVLLEERVPITAASSWPMCHATLLRGFDRQRRGRPADVDPRLQRARWPAGHRAVMPPRRARSLARPHRRRARVTLETGNRAGSRAGSARCFPPRFQNGRLRDAAAGSPNSAQPAFA